MIILIVGVREFLKMIEPKKYSSVIAALLVGPAVSIQAYAEIYLSEAQATSIFFPGEILKRAQIDLSAEQIKKIEKQSGESLRSSKITLWKAVSGGVVFIDQVLGKHEFITYAVGIKQGKILGVEILEYRESYGNQIRKPDWRKQFIGKDSKSELKIGSDIKNISGATLSSGHVTDGVKRILQTYDTIQNHI